jgi:hypothetical protein
MLRYKLQQVIGRLLPIAASSVCSAVEVCGLGSRGQ